MLKFKQPVSRPRVFQRLVTLIALSVAGLNAHADQVMVAVAANFAAPMKVIAQQFERDTGHQVRMSFGSTGQFYAQIKNGAPFSILLAADERTPEKIEQEGLGVAGTRFTYATGKLVLWSKKPGLVDGSDAILRSEAADKVAIANPKLAPYGAAAVDVINKLGLTDKLTPNIVEGANVGQVYQFVASGNATVGFIALSQVYENGKISQGSAWMIPSVLHQPIKQDAILLNKGRANAAANLLMTYLQGDQAAYVIRSFGYER